MTTESVQKLYINDNKKLERFKVKPANNQPSKLDLDLEFFALRERQDGFQPSVIAKHEVEIRTSLAVIAERRNVLYTQITKDDLGYLIDTLTVREYNWPVSYARITAKFVAFITKNPPLIPLGRMEFKAHQDALLVAKTKTLGTMADRQRIMSEHGSQIVAFLDAMRNVKFDNKSERCLCAAIFVLEKVNGEFNPDDVVLEDIMKMKRFMADFGVSKPGRYASLMVRFVSFATGNPPLREISASVVPSEDWTAGLPEQCPFVDQMSEYAQILDSRGFNISRKSVTLARSQIFGALLNIRFEVKTLFDVTPEMLDLVCKEISTHVSPTTARRFRHAFLDFSSYFGRGDLRQQVISFTGRRPFVPNDDYDRHFIEKLDEWSASMNQWAYKTQTIKERLSAIKLCYKTLKQAKGPFELTSLVPVDIKTLRDAMSGYSTSTVKLYLQIFGLFLKFAIGRNLYEEAHIWFSGHIKQRNFVTMDEFQALWRVGGPMEHMILALGGAMGIRKAEMIGLKLSDFNDSVVTIRGKGAGPDGKVVKMEIPDLVHEALAEYLPYRAELLKYGDRSEDRLLVNPNPRDLGRPMSVSCHQNVVKKLSEKAGIYFTTHGLRRLFATNLADAGLDLDTIRRMMRHSSIDTTLSCYIMADPRKMHGAVNSVNSIFSVLKLNHRMNRTNRLEHCSRPTRIGKKCPETGIFCRFAHKG